MSLLEQFEVNVGNKISVFRLLTISWKMLPRLLARH